jgi:hypothetical protein
MEPTSPDQQSSAKPDSLGDLMKPENPKQVVKEMMIQVMAKLETANQRLEGRLFVPFGVGEKKALIFDTPVRRTVEEPGGQPKEEDDFLVVSSEGYSLIQVESEAGPHHYDIGRYEIARPKQKLPDTVRIEIDRMRRMTKDKDVPLNERGQGYQWRHEDPGRWDAYEAKLGYQDRGVVISDLFAVDNSQGVTYDAQTWDKEGGPIVYKNISEMRLLDNPDPEIVSNILRVNKSRAEEEIAEEAARPQRIAEEARQAEERMKELLSRKPLYTIKVAGFVKTEAEEEAEEQQRIAEEARQAEQQKIPNIQSSAQAIDDILS